MPLTSTLGTTDTVLGLSFVLGDPDAIGAVDGNLSFEEDRGDGTPAGWSVTVVSTARVIAPYEWPATEYGLRGEENFESGWAGNDDYLTTWPTDSGAVLVALFSGQVLASPASADGFEYGWGNTPYFTTDAVFLEDGPGPDDFESGWGNDDFQTTFTPADLAPATFSGGTLPYESFEKGWGADAFASTWSQVTPTVALFAGVRLDTAETFNRVFAGDAYGLNGSGTFTYHTNILTVGSTISFALTGAGKMPTGLQAGVPYYVLSAVFAHGQLSFTISDSPGGTQLVPTNDGTGTNIFTDPAEYWTTLMVTI